MKKNFIRSSIYAAMTCSALFMTTSAHATSDPWQILIDTSPPLVLATTDPLPYYDFDGDGVFSPEEEIFGYADTDKSATLDLQEYIALKESLIRLNIIESCKTMDRDANGVVTPEEFMSGFSGPVEYAQPVFNELLTTLGNPDGTLNTNFWEQADTNSFLLQYITGTMNDRLTWEFSILDADKNNAISFSDYYFADHTIAAYEYLQRKTELEAKIARLETRVENLQTKLATATGSKAKRLKRRLERVEERLASAREDYAYMLQYLPD